MACFDSEYGTEMALMNSAEHGGDMNDITQSNHPRLAFWRDHDGNKIPGQICGPKFGDKFAKIACDDSNSQVLKMYVQTLLLSKD
jgi:hypothetical protein